MQHTGAVEVGLLALILAGVVFAWDGLVRRHIRLTRDIIAMRIDIRGESAILLGGLGLALTLFAGIVGIEQTMLIVERCRYSASCMWSNLVIPPFTSWATAFGLIIAVAAFGLWVRGAFDLSGSYRRRWFAPGVRDDEKAIVEQVKRALDDAQLPSVDTDTITKTANWARHNFGFMSLRTLSSAARTNRLDSHHVTQLMLASKAFNSPQLNESQARVMLGVIVKHYTDLYTRVGQAYVRKGRPQKGHRNTRTR